MATITTFIFTTVEIVLKSNINKLINVFLNAKDFPKKLPEVYKNVNLNISKDLRQIDIVIEYAKGNPIRNGTDRVVAYFPQDVKASFEVVSGDYTFLYKSYEGSVQLVEDKCSGGTRVIRTYKVERKLDSPDLSKFVFFDIETLLKIDKIAQSLD